MITIACLYTADSNIPLFTAAADQIGLTDARLNHHLRSDLLAAAEAAGGLIPAIAETTRAVLLDLAAKADVVILNCSTLGPAIDHRPWAPPVPMLAADRALAAEAWAAPGPLTVLYTAPSSRAATTAAFKPPADRLAPTIALVDEAWGLFKAGAFDAYLDRITAAADQAFAQGQKTVALAQTSMAGAAGRCRHGTALTVPVAALKAARALISP